MTMTAVVGTLWVDQDLLRPDNSTPQITMCKRNGRFFYETSKLF